MVSNKIDIVEARFEQKLDALINQHSDQLKGQIRNALLNSDLSKKKNVNLEENIGELTNTTETILRNWYYPAKEERTPRNHRPRNYTHDLITAGLVMNFHTITAIDIPKDVRLRSDGYTGMGPLTIYLVAIFDLLKVGERNAIGLLRAYLRNR